MKKLLKMSLVAALAVSPLMASAADVNPSAYAIPEGQAGKTTQTAQTPVAAAGKLFEGKTVYDADKGIVATGAYVKGAYNAAISAVNKVATDLTTNLTLTEGDGIDITNNVVSVDLSDNKGLQIDDTNKTLEINKGDGLDFNATSGAVEVKGGDGIAVDANGVAVDLTANKGLVIDDTTKKLEIKDGDGIKTGANGVEVDLTSLGGLEIDQNSQLKAKVDGTTISIDATSGALKANLGDYATKAGVVNTIESSSVQTVTGVSMTGGEGITAYTDWTDETANGQTTLGASSITVTTGRANVEITRAAGSENTVENKYTTTAVTPAASGTTPSNATSSTTYPVAQGAQG